MQQKGNIWRETWENAKPVRVMLFKILAWPLLFIREQRHHSHMDVKILLHGSLDEIYRFFISTRKVVSLTYCRAKRWSRRNRKIEKNKRLNIYSAVIKKSIQLEWYLILFSFALNHGTLFRKVWKNNIEVGSKSQIIHWSITCMILWYWYLK